MKQHRKTMLGVLIFVAVLAVLLPCATASRESGSLPIRDGIVRVEGDNWLIINEGTTRKPSYRKLAEVNAPQGWSLTGTDANYDDNEVYYTFSSSVASFEGVVCMVMAAEGSFHSMPEQTAELMSQYFDGEVSSVAEVEFENVHCRYYWFAAKNRAPEGGKANMQYINAYFPTVRQEACVALNIQAEYFGDAVPLSNEQILALIESFARAIAFTW